MKKRQRRSQYGIGEIHETYYSGNKVPGMVVGISQDRKSYQLFLFQRAITIIVQHENIIPRYIYKHEREHFDDLLLSGLAKIYNAIWRNIYERVPIEADILTNYGWIKYMLQNPDDARRLYLNKFPGSYDFWFTNDTLFREFVYKPVSVERRVEHKRGSLSKLF